MVEPCSQETYDDVMNWLSLDQETIDFIMGTSHDDEDMDMIVSPLEQK